MLSKLILAITLVVSSVMALVSQPEIENVGYPAPLEGYPMEVVVTDEFPAPPSATPTTQASATPYPLVTPKASSTPECFDLLALGQLSAVPTEWLNLPPCALP